MPEVVDALHAAGDATDASAGFAGDGGDGVSPAVVEQVLRASAARQQGLTWVTKHVDKVEVADGAATGLVVDGKTLPADIVRRRDRSRQPPG